MTLRLAVLGAGAVGGSVLDLASTYGHEVVAFADSSSSVTDSTGLDPETVRARKERDGIVGDADPDAVFDTNYDVLIEATPTTLGDAEPGFSHVERALLDDRHVVLANKGPVAERYADLRALEAESEGRVQFEATVGGAIPVLSTISDLGAGHVTAARGVLNGTANFILSRMAAEGLDYEHVLAEAQDLGVAEADPSFDVDGIDAALKFVILANVLSDGETEYRLDDAEVEGIRNVPGTALDLAAEDGRTVRLIGEATADGVRVAPRLVPQGSTLAVTGTQNIVQLETKHAGQLNISGRGAGGPETATAVLSDVSRFE
ncbi:homoserine dehydrogenase [Haloferax mediterranei ATCC 33500]|uniref:homoserine dehydrogenase n=1 Tax=Haloferax mediterranei (strain ATCC 33500 / DSM 1411 / JCM 8866 / NBRC 14739 / NCIMB 2177 / R-4) TaxID=523841 RepID=I3R1H2_HALMT|nr:homoserine dehydrogenase [Haloferax mediterranei]AFK18082.1 homoserine dehydrogenase [Haloferax mediterranei ATCC 33500]AHZ22507.1 homoserine dehydrogenase [Haloferax mediterranei ATCC 33500]EMA02644.1 homoserine dehydrogenase [Haloferax mediterranei ATCC 33500]MDX5988173.1 homoserine dehydrogenase [Haloferax mediterranei ATCC 33500]QCQ74618.1 homoserine dehydrogenase [Haloferax mediterranei ATCC 33500]